MAQRTLSGISHSRASRLGKILQRRSRASLNDFMLPWRTTCKLQDDPDFYFEVFAKLDNLDSSRLIVAGDLNVALAPLDYQGSCPAHSNKNASEALVSLMDEFNLIDVWRNEHPMLRAYTRHQKNPPVLSRLDYILVSSNLADNVKHSEIVCGIKSDHSIVKCKISINNPPKGKS